MASDHHVVLAGGGLAAQRCCEALRRAGHAGRITLVGAERVAPYDRPPLSKRALAGTVDAAALAFRPPDWYAAQEVGLRLGAAAAHLDPDRRELQLEDGARLRYDRLLIATGAAPRRLAGLDGAPNVHVLRRAGDAAALERALRPGRRLVVVGAGFIGLEVAAAARGRGTEVTVIEAAEAPLTGVLGPVLGGWLAGLHREHGVDVRCGVTVREGRRCADGAVDSLVFDDARTIGCDAVVVGIGTTPADGWLAGSGLGGEGGGVACDAEGRTAAEGVFAAGDVARPFDPVLGRHARTEHWEAAARQGAAAARAMLGLPPAPATLAGFWSDQFGVRIQHLGHPSLGDDLTLDGDLAAHDFTAVWRRGDRPVAALLGGRPRDLATWRRAIHASLHAIHPELMSSCT